MIKMIFNHLSGMYFWVLGPDHGSTKDPYQLDSYKTPVMPAFATVM